MNKSLGVSPSEGNQGTTRGKEKILLTLVTSVGIEPDLRISSTVTLPTELRGRTEKVGDDLGYKYANYNSSVNMESSSRWKPDSWLLKNVLADSANSTD